MSKMTPQEAFLSGRHEMTRDEIVTVAATNGVIARRNPRRTQILLVNYGTSDVRVGWKALTGTSQGIPVFANGGSVKFRVDRDGAAVFGDLHAIGVAGGLSVQVYEWEAKDDA